MNGSTGNRFQILALDGGGYKGMFAATVLACLEADLGITMADHFDLVTGTSSGGIIALGLGAGLRPAEISDFYVTHGTSIFRRKTPGRRLWRSKYAPDGISSALGEAFGDKRLGESVLRLAIPAYDLTNDNVYLFRTPHAQFLRRDHRERMVDVALATTAAPTYLPAHRLRGLRLIDGGMWANNPVLVGIAEAVRVFGKSLSDIAVLSIGTTTDLAMRRRTLDRGGMLAWSMDAIPLVLHGQSRAARNFAHHLLPDDGLLRIDPLVPQRALRMDGIEPDDLRGRAEHESRRMGARFLERFGQHRAPPYVPLNF
jgi:uncharacterized protein